MLSRRTLSLPTGHISILERDEPQPGKPSLVLLHGLMGAAAIFAPLMEAFSPDQHVIAVDFPGAGDSNRSASSNPSLPSLSGLIVQVIDALDLTRPVLVGHSHGGAVALYLAASHPTRVHGLVLLAPAHPHFRHADRLIGFYLSPLGKLFAHSLPWFPAFLQQIGLRMVVGPRRFESRVRLQLYRENLRTRGTIALLLRLLKTWQLDMRELEHLLEAPFDVPTLLLWGDHDRVVPASTAPDLMKHLRSAEWHSLPGIGHLPAEEAPQLCASLIEAWFAHGAVTASRRSSGQVEAFGKPTA